MDEVRVRKSERMHLNPEPLKIVPTAQRDVWLGGGSLIYTPPCYLCGSIRAKREKVGYEVRCVNRRQCRRRERAWD